jgi:regulatory protein
MLLRNDKETKIKLSIPEAAEKIKKWCAYQERCHTETRQKLYEFGLNPGDIEAVLAMLIGENFLNEERFAKTFARGKFRIKQWGKNKIKQELKAKGVSDYSIKKGLKEINEDDYIKALELLLTKKDRNLTEKNDFLRKQKLFMYAISKGYETDIIKDYLKNHWEL